MHGISDSFPVAIGGERIVYGSLLWKLTVESAMPCACLDLCAPDNVCGYLANALRGFLRRPASGSRPGGGDGKINKT